MSFCTSRACARQNPVFPPLLAQRPLRKRPFLVIFPLDLPAVSGVAARCSLTFSWSVSAAASYSRGTEGSNPASSSGESIANLTAQRVNMVAKSVVSLSGPRVRHA